MGQLADPALGGAGAVHLGGIEERRTGGHAGVERALFLVAVRGAATVGQLGRGPAGAARWIAPGHRPDAQAGNLEIGSSERHRTVMARSIRRTSQ